jgi:hypothetical protein
MAISRVMKARRVTYVCSCSDSSEALRSLKNASTSVVRGSLVTPPCIALGISSILSTSPHHSHVHLLLRLWYLTRHEMSKSHSLAWNHSYTSVWQWLYCPPNTSNSGIGYVGTAETLIARKRRPKKLWPCPSTHPYSFPLIPTNIHPTAVFSHFLGYTTKGRRLVSFLLSSFLGSTSIGNDMS